MTVVSSSGAEGEEIRVQPVTVDFVNAQVVPFSE